MSTCPSCNSENLGSDFRFCPYCGYELGLPHSCPKCAYENEINSKFCQECGTSLFSGETLREKPPRKTSKPLISVSEIPPPPSNGITIEFPFSTAGSFDFAVHAAKNFPTFQQFGEAKKALYRVNFETILMESALELAEHLKGWRKRVVYVNGEKVPWDAVFSFTWCFGKRKSSFKPDFYCFGYEDEWSINIWGCIQAGHPFTENGDWCKWGRWINKRGDWEYDKERIRHELQKNIYPYRFCPAIQLELVQESLKALPDQVNPTKNKNWNFIESWGDETGGLVVTTNKFGIKQQVVMNGVGPTRGAIKEIARKVGGLKIRA